MCLMRVDVLGRGSGCWIGRVGNLADLRSCAVQLPSECAGRQYTGCEEGCVVDATCGFRGDGVGDGERGRHRSSEGRQQRWRLVGLHNSGFGKETIPRVLFLIETKNCTNMLEVIDLQDVRVVHNEAFRTPLQRRRVHIDKRTP
jgi:hypothetical protein